jgi:type II secretory pathway component PulF
MVAIAEETGRLVRSCSGSHSYESELDDKHAHARLARRALMLFVTAAVIGTVVLAMLLPILTLQERR